MGQIQTLDDLLDLLRRRWLLIAALAGLGALAALLHALSLPRSYESIAVIQIESSAVSAEGAAGGMSPAQRLQLIEQRLMVRENLVGMIGRHGLFAERESLTLNEKVALLRRAVRIEPVTAARPGFGDARVTALVIFVQLDDPVLAATVANEFADGILARNRAQQDERLRESLAFFAAEEERLAAAIAGLEAEIAAFQTANSDALPEGLASRREERLRLDEELREIDRRMLAAERERAALAADTPVRAVAQRQIDLLATEIAVLAEQRAPLAARRDRLDAAIGRTPSVAMTLGTYDRRLQQVQEQYAAIARRRAEAEAGQRLEDGWQGERFSMLEVALPPEHPVASGRRKALVFGVAGSAMAALGLAFLLDLLNPAVRSAAQLERQLGLRAVAVIPHVETPAETRRRRAAAAGGTALALAALLAALAAAGRRWLGG